MSSSYLGIPSLPASSIYRDTSAEIGAPRLGAAQGPQTSTTAMIATAILNQLALGYANFAAVRSATMEQRSQASALDSQARLLEIDRRDAERQAQAILGRGQAEIASVTLEGGQRRGAIRAQAGARGIAGDSVREAQLSDRLIQDLEVYHINEDTVRAANAARSGGVEIDRRALFARTSARNLRSSARSAAPEAQLLAGLAGAGLAYADRTSRRR